ncbi:exo-alpha-sialidase [Streptodolium elevatio]
MTDPIVLAVGTRKGLWLGRSEDGGQAWDFTGPHHPMTGVYSVLIDKRGPAPRLLAGVTSEHFGPAVAATDDFGATWGAPSEGAIAFPKDADASVERVWQLQPGAPDSPDALYAGVEPSALFRSEDGGRSWSLVRGLWDHPHRPQWTPGFGGMAIHTVLPHPTEAGDMTVAMSTGGVYRTRDDGKSWEASNTGIRAYFLPDQYPEFGQCVHKVARHPEHPDRLFLQNHHGVYRSDDGGATWNSIAEGLPSDFGFPIAVHPDRPETVYAFPLVADAMRFPPEGRCRIYRSDDAGETWTGLEDGLPDEGFWTGVMRDALCMDDTAEPNVYFGTRSGEVYIGREGGAQWHRVAEHLPDVLCVRAAVVPAA